MKQSRKKHSPGFKPKPKNASAIRHKNPKPYSKESSARPAMKVM